MQCELCQHVRHANLATLRLVRPSKPDLAACPYQNLHKVSFGPAGCDLARDPPLAAHQSLCFNGAPAPDPFPNGISGHDPELDGKARRR